MSLWKKRSHIPENGGVSERSERGNDLPRRAVTRTAKLASLPLGFAGRTALGFGKRIGGRPAEIVATEIQQRTAEQIFKVLGELKGGAMKLGQGLSIFEAALPPEIAEPYRATLTKLQEAAPPLPAATVHRVLEQGLGPDWRDRFQEFDDEPSAAASIGQVHKAVWEDGRTVAVKVQYPGAGKALISDFSQLARLGRMFSSLMPGLEVKPLLAELRERIVEELDYGLEAEAQRAFAETYRDDPDFVVPEVVADAENVLVTEWIEGTPLSAIISRGMPEERDNAGLLYIRFLLSGPCRVRMLHADPHPGNFRLMEDGRLGVLDFGAVSRLPEGPPSAIGKLLRIGLLGDAETVERGLRAEGFIREGIEVDAQMLLDFLLPSAEPARYETFHFNREWLREETARITELRPTNVLRQLNLPPSYMLIHRVITAATGVMCQLEAVVALRGEFEDWLPGFIDEDAVNRDEPDAEVVG
ncbi:MAG: AarF/ABC1/UbiB kinase family protein [Streptosporangiales bacterium]|nr:AarF/ABC1/UbiB kinase family protein [Streptosporangiales bacterium]